MACPMIEIKIHYLSLKPIHSKYNLALFIELSTKNRKIFYFIYFSFRLILSEYSTHTKGSGKKIIVCIKFNFIIKALIFYSLGLVEL